MKKLLLTYILFFTPKIFAGFGNCPNHILSHKNGLKMLEFLEEVQGRFQLGSCYVELQVCNLNGTDPETRKNTIGDLLIVDKEGFERYISFFIPEFSNSQAHQMSITNDRMLHYRFNDKNYDQATGKYERWAVEFVKTSDLKKLKYIEIGFASQVERTNKTSKKWIVCGTEREEEIKNQRRKI